MRVVIVCATVALVAACGASGSDTGSDTSSTTSTKATATGVSDGTYEVGVDIKPGKYKTAGSTGDNPVGCYVAVLRSSDTSDIATNNISKGPQTVVVRKGQYLDVTGCKPLVRVG